MDLELGRTRAVVNGAAAKLRGCDRLSILAALAMAATSFAAQPAQPVVGMAALAIASSVVVLAVRSRCGRMQQWLHDFSPPVVLAILFKLAGILVPNVNDARWDDVLASVDARRFTQLGAAWRSALGRPDWLTDLASVAYVSFHVAPILIAVQLYRRVPRRVFDSYVLTLQATYFLTWIGYFAFPALGPRVPVTAQDRLLGGSVVSDVVRWALRTFEGDMLDAFPSGHVAISLVYVAFAWRHLPRLRLALIAFEVPLVFSTVYLSLHYVTDVIAGAVLAGAVALWRWGASSRDARAHISPPVHACVARPSSRMRAAHDPSDDESQRARSHGRRSPRPA